MHTKPHKTGFLLFYPETDRYRIDTNDTLSVVAGELLLREILNSRKYMNGRLLDIGCGKKPYSMIYKNLVKSQFGTEVIYSLHGISSADLICPAEKLPFPSNYFDTILCTEVLEHTNQPIEVFKEMVRILRPEGHLILTVPFIYPLHEEPYDNWRFTSHSLSLLSKQNQLTICELHPRARETTTLFVLGINIIIWFLNLVSIGLHLRKPIREWRPIRSAIVAVQYSWLFLFERTPLQRPPKMTLGYHLVARKITL